MAEALTMATIGLIVLILLVALMIDGIRHVLRYFRTRYTDDLYSGGVEVFIAWVLIILLLFLTGW